jgi:hypothetical protein
MAQTDRDILFANESFVIGMLQAVSGGSLVAAISQAEALVKYAGRFPFAILLTAMGFGLAASVLAAYWKHQYKMWDVKAQVSASKGNTAEATQRAQSAGTYLTAMRRAMLCSVVVIVLGLGALVAAFWYRAVNG